MKWILFLFFFASTIAFGQVDNNSVLEKLKKTDKLMGRDEHNSFQPKLRTLTPMQNENIQSDNERVFIPLRKLRTLTHMQSEIIQKDDERAIVSLPFDHMPCIVPNMNLFRAMPNAGSLALLKNPTDPGIYMRKPNRELANKQILIDTGN